MTQAVQGNPAFADTAFEEYEQRKLPVEEILSRGLPADQVVWRSYLNRQVEQQRVLDATIVWSWLVPRGYANNETADRFVRFLIDKKEVAKAAGAWADYVSGQSAGYQHSNYVFNGDFERKLTKGALDWQLREGAGFKVALDSLLAHGGHYSARVRFDGAENVGSASLSESTFLPAGRYKFQAYVKTDEITTNQGMFFGLSATGVNVTTDNFLGTRDWTLVEKTFQVPPDAGLLEVSLRRNPSLKFDNQIKGTVWIDDVRIAPLR